MSRASHWIAMALSMLAVTGCHRGLIRLREAPGSDRHVWRAPLDVQQFASPCEDLFYVVEPPIGYSMARHRPLKGFTLQAKARWTTAVMPLSSLFESLAGRHNRAELSVQEFETARAQLLEATARLAEKKAALDAVLEQYDAARAAAALPDANAVQKERAEEHMQDARSRAETLIEDGRRYVESLTAPHSPPPAEGGTAVSPR